MHVLGSKWHLFLFLVPDTPSFTLQPDCPGLSFADINWQVYDSIYMWLLSCVLLIDVDIYLIILSQFHFQCLIIYNPK